MKIRYLWKCNTCGGSGKCYLPKHRATRGARGHSKRKNETLDITLVREDGRMEILSEIRMDVII